MRKKVLKNRLCRVSHLEGRQIEGERGPADLDGRDGGRLHVDADLELALPVLAVVLRVQLQLVNAARESENENCKL
jgi:hypothetical protein